MNGVLVTGASGFVGSAVVKRLVRCSGIKPRASVRSQNHNFDSDIDIVNVGGLGLNTDWSKALQGIDVVVHAAARVHMMHDNKSDQLAEFRRVNVAGSLKLARMAASAGVKRFVFVSSIKVNGEETSLGKPYRADDPPFPADSYGVSKMEAELGLRQIAEETGMEVVIIRPPLVYGPGVKANFQSMMHWVGRGVPLPFGAVYNKRSFLAIDNLVDFIFTCITHPNAANQIFLVADGEDLSTTELLQRVGLALGKPARLIPVDPKFLRLGASMIGKKAMIQRLCGSLQVDILKARELLGWTPPINVDEGLRRTAEGFKR